MVDIGAIRPGLNIRARREGWSDLISVLFIDAKFSDGRLLRSSLAKPMLFQESRPEDAGILVEPTISLRFEEAQRLMDELWECGLRPTEGSGSAGQLAAVQRHLEDMRRLTFSALDGAKERGDG